MSTRPDGLSASATKRIEIGSLEDEIETCFARGWSDGLPVVPPTEERIMHMLSGTTRSPDELVGIVPPNYNECTVEKVAINAVLAGCNPNISPSYSQRLKPHSQRPLACTACSQPHSLQDP